MSRILPLGLASLTQGAYSNLVSKHASKQALANALTSTSSAAAKYGSGQTSSTSPVAAQSLVPATEKNVKELSAALADKMDTLFKKAGLKTAPPIEISVDVDSGKITVESKRADAGKIETLLNGNETIKVLAQTLDGLNSRAYAASENLQFQKECRVSTNAQAVLAKYAALFGPQTTHTFSMSYGGDGVQMLADGKSWLTSASST